MPWRSDDGFIAVIAVMMLALGTIVFSLVTLGSAVSYADMVNRKEFRIQADMNVEACLDTVRLMHAKDYFLTGTVVLDEFGCKAQVDNDFDGMIAVSARAVFEGVSAYGVIVGE